MNNKIKKYPMNISIQTLTVKLMWDGWEGSTSSSESTCVKLNGLDLFLKAPTCLNKTLAKMRLKLRSKEQPEELSESCSKTQTRTRLEFCFTHCFYELCGLHILIWKNFGSAKTSYSCLSEQTENLGGRVLFREVAKTLNISLTELHRSCVETESFRPTTTPAALVSQESEDESWEILRCPHEVLRVG